MKAARWGRVRRTFPDPRASASQSGTGPTGPMSLVTGGVLQRLEKSAGQRVHQAVARGLIRQGARNIVSSAAIVAMAVRTWSGAGRSADLISCDMETMGFLDVTAVGRVGTKLQVVGADVVGAGRMICHRRALFR